MRTLASTIRAATIAVLLVGTTAVPAPSAPALVARPVASLTLDERAKLLPIATTVIVHGRTTTLGVLRDEHRLRMVRFHGATMAAAGKALGARLQSAVPTTISFQAAHLNGSKTLPPAKGTPPLIAPLNGHVPTGSAATTISTPAAAGASTLTPIVESAAHLASEPLDMQQYCAAAAATACYYLPPNTTLYHEPLPGQPWFDDDPLIPPDQCAAEKGKLVVGACEFVYPPSDTMTFLPGLDPTFTYTTACDDALFKVRVDSKGAVVLTPTPFSGPMGTTGPDPAGCAVRAFVRYH